MSLRKIWFRSPWSYHRKLHAHCQNIDAFLEALFRRSSCAAWLRRWVLPLCQRCCRSKVVFCSKPSCLSDSVICNSWNIVMLSTGTSNSQNNSKWSYLKLCIVLRRDYATVARNARSHCGLGACKFFRILAVELWSSSIHLRSHLRLTSFHRLPL